MAGMVSALDPQHFKGIIAAAPRLVQASNAGERAVGSPHCQPRKRKRPTALSDTVRDDCMPS